MARIPFKKEKVHQLMLLPPDVGSLVPENHLVRMVDKIINELEISPLFSTYKGGGASSYHPRTMLKIITYAYIEKIYTTRHIEKALRENINFMWISGMITPDHGTIHNFKSKRLKQAVEDVFASLIEVLINAGYVKSENLFVDGTKIEANANRYSYVWRKNVEKHEAKTKEHVRILLYHIDELQNKEDKEYGTRNLEELEGNITSEQVDKLVKDINEKIKRTPETKEITKEITQLKNDIPKLRKYEEQKNKLDNRNSYSKTDKDATFFRMKEDHLGQGQLKPAYNVQIATEKQFILSYGIYQKAADTTLLIPVLNKVQSQLKRTPKRVIADAGYGCEENYEYLKKKKISNYVKYNTFDIERTSKYQARQFSNDKFTYDQEKDQYTCPQNKILTFVGIKQVRSETGYNSKRRIYKASSCSDCPSKSLCCKGEGDKRIEFNRRLVKLKEIARKNLMSQKGIKLRSQRCVDVESVFGQIKHDNKFRRFNSRGLSNVNIEWGLISIAHNIKKMAN
ncbi:MAG: IS1182 family transposase [Alphaproteobacteria bacterium]|nr:MAG: IS1182 family transposase [Alphaproteobacteria bacterium]